MKPFKVFTLLAGLGSAANLNLWDIDDSCHPHMDALQKAFDDAELMAVKARDDLELLNDARPRFAIGKTDERNNWDRIARAVTAVFGFVPDKKGHDPKEDHWSNVMKVYDDMVKTLHEGVMVPENGYTGLQPLILCNQNKFIWVGRNDVDPHDIGGRLLYISRPDLIKDEHAGAWVYKERYMASTERQANVGMCPPGRWAVTQTGFDVIAICPKSFSDDAHPQSASEAKASLKAGDKLNSWTHTSLSKTTVHELAHWFGGPNNRVPDQHAVNRAGELVYHNPATNKYVTDRNIPGVTKVVVYDYFWVANLARTHDGPNSGNSGPSKATFTAEAYAMFAAMS
ncbi:hypothetical protein ACHAPO_011658 [Fusarium lateritium]